MAVLRLRFVVLFVLLMSLTAGCGYQLTNSPSRRLGSARNIWIPYFSNLSVSPTAQTVLRRAFYEELHAMRGLNPAKDKNVADLVVEAKIVSYSSGAVSYNALDQVREYNLTVDAELEIARKGMTAPFWKGRIQGSKRYPVSSDLALQRNSEEQALDAVSRIIAQKFITAAEESSAL